MPVSQTEPSYEKNVSIWELTRDAAKGVTLEAAKKYIPRRSHEDQDKYYQRMCMMIMQVRLRGNQQK